MDGYSFGLGVFFWSLWNIVNSKVLQLTCIIQYGGLGYSWMAKTHWRHRYWDGLVRFEF